MKSKIMYDKELIMDVKDLKVSFFNEKGTIEVIRKFDIRIRAGEIIGIIGESGSGKTVSARSMMRLIEKDEGTIENGEIIYKGNDLLKINEEELNKIRGKEISYVFQDPVLALNPYKKIGRQLSDARKNHGLNNSKEIIIQSLKEVGLDDPNTVYEKYPHQLSIGQNQRVLISQSILCRPKLLIADEPTSSIDASLRKKILELFKEINEKYEISIILITHDFDITKFLCDRILIMYGGLVVEEAETNEIFSKPIHPYTEGLLSCSGSLNKSDEVLYSIEGTPLTPNEFKNECPFYSRCKYRINECKVKIPDMIVMGERKVRCISKIVNERMNNG